VRFENVKVIGANDGNANADGMDWLDGSGDTVVTNSFFRAADDIFALQDSWEGYGPKAFAVDGKPVGNIRVDRSVLSTSISNVVRAGWPEKNFAGGHFTMEDSDVIHAGMGGCGTPFALMEIWANPNSRGKSGDFAFRDIRMDDWYSLVNIQQKPVGGVSDISFQDVYGLEQPSLVPSILQGNVHHVSFDNVVLGGVLATKAIDVPLKVEDGADRPTFTATGPVIKIMESGELVRPHKYIKFEAILESGEAAGIEYTWNFGDGTSEVKGRSVEHEFPDTDGTLLDGSGRFRVLLHAIDRTGRNAWAYDPVVVAKEAQSPLMGSAETPAGVQFHYYELDHPELSDLLPPDGGEYPTGGLKTIGVRETIDLATIKHRAENYGIVYDAYLDIPDDGGYTFTLLTNDEGVLRIDGKPVVMAPATFPQFCGSVGNAVRSATGSVALGKGKHRLQIAETHSKGEDGFSVFWQRSGAPISYIPAENLSHEHDMQ
jgi:hypothetical protein